MSQRQVQNAFLASDYSHDNKKHLLLAASGSVATIKLPHIVQRLSVHDKLSVRIVLTHAASRFLAGQSDEQPTLATLQAMKNVDGIYHDSDEWGSPWTRGSSILHIELRRWADLMVIAPLSANSLAKMTAGLCDNLMLSVARAWDTTGETDVLRRKKLIIVAPAMNTAMWKHPITTQQIKILEDWSISKSPDGWIKLLAPIEKKLACGDVGDGAMREWTTIVSEIEEQLSLD